MKKLVITLSLAALVGTSYGQGYVTVAGTQSNSTNATVNIAGTATGNGTIGTMLVGGANSANWNVVLLTATSGTGIAGAVGTGTSLYNNATAVNSWLDTSLLGHGGAGAGRISIGSDVLANNAGVGVTQDWLLVAWSASLGTSWSQVAAELSSGVFSTATGPGYLGWSTIGSGAAGAASPALPLTIQGSSGSIIPTGFTLYAVPVPEPSTLALMGLGSLSLLLFRRRNSK